MTSVRLELSEGARGGYEIHVVGVDDRPITDAVNVARDGSLAPRVAAGTLAVDGTATVTLEPTSPPAAVDAAILPAGAVYRVELSAPRQNRKVKFHIAVPDSEDTLDAVDLMTDTPTELTVIYDGGSAGSIGAIEDGGGAAA